MLLKYTKNTPKLVTGMALFQTVVSKKQSALKSVGVVGTNGQWESHPCVPGRRERKNERGLGLQRLRLPLAVWDAGNGGFHQRFVGHSGWQGGELLGPRQRQVDLLLHQLRPQSPQLGLRLVAQLEEGEQAWVTTRCRVGPAHELAPGRPRLALPAVLSLRWCATARCMGEGVAFGERGEGKWSGLMYWDHY